MTHESFPLATRTGSYAVRRAKPDDLPAIVALLTDDVLGRNRESGEQDAYRAAFDEISADSNQFLAVVEGEESTPIATMQLTLIPGLSRGAAKRLQIESVRVASSARDSGLGTALFRWAEDHARAHGATLLQLTTDKQRVDAHRFYDQLGYVASHVGYKRSLAD